MGSCTFTAGEEFHKILRYVFSFVHEDIVVLKMLRYLYYVNSVDLSLVVDIGICDVYFVESASLFPASCRGWQ